MEIGPKLSAEFKVPSTEDHLNENFEGYEEYFDMAVPVLLEALDYDSWEALDLVNTLLRIRSDDIYQDDPALVAACYNGYRAGWLIADSVTPYDLKMTLMGIITAPMGEHTWDQLIESTQRTISESPHLDNLINKYTNDIDPTGKHGHLIEIFAGLAIAMTEKATIHTRIQQNIERFGTELNDWDGEI
jgi:hypothetical protein